MPISKLMRVRVEVFMKIMADGATGEQRMRLAGLLHGLEVGGQVEQSHDLRRREVVDREEAVALQVQVGDARLELRRVVRQGGVCHGSPPF